MPKHPPYVEIRIINTIPSLDQLLNGARPSTPEMGAVVDTILQAQGYEIDETPQGRLFRDCARRMRETFARKRDAMMDRVFYGGGDRIPEQPRLLTPERLEQLRYQHREMMKPFTRGLAL